MDSSGKPLITIGLPMRNAECTVIATVRSIFAQTFPSWELLAVDDGSTDATVEIVRKIRDPRVKVLADGEHRGLVYRLNQISSLADTPYVARMDADDLMHPERLARQLNFLENHPEIALVGASAWIIDSLGNIIGVRDLPVRTPTALEVLRRGRFIHPAVMGRREWFIENPYDPDFPRAEDHELWCRTYGNHGFATLTDRLLFYRDHTGPIRTKYIQSYQTGRRILRRYGPSIAGSLQTACLIGESWAKQMIYTAATVVHASDRLASVRNQAAPQDLVAQCEQTLRSLENIAVPGLS